MTQIDPLQNQSAVDEDEELAAATDLHGHGTAFVRARSALSACAGNLIEWFDFFVYAYTSIYFAPVFFPEADRNTQLLSTAGVFAVGFFMRPLGGWVFGRIADTRGRKFAMIASIILMCFGSLLIAVLPTYAAIGFFAPLLLLFARLLQGLSVGAEYGTGATYLSEIASKGRRGLFSSLQYATIVAGQLLALLIVIGLQHFLAKDQFMAWGWRIPFALGAVGAIVVLALRRGMVETATEASMHRQDAGSIRSMLQHKRAVVLVLCLTMGGSLYFYTFTTYMQKFLVVSAEMAPEQASLLMSLALVAFMFMQPLFGLLSDRIGARASMRIFAILATLGAAPILFAIQGAQNSYQAFTLVLAGLTILAFYTPISGIIKADLFPIEVRALGVGLPYAVANAIFGGTAEYVALFLRSTGMETTFFYYVAGVTSISAIAALLMPDLRMHGYLDGDGEVERNTGLAWRR